ncbi:MAG: ABC transporter substrate-binding protein [Gemmataceae bacterium]
MSRDDIRAQQARAPGRYRWWLAPVAVVGVLSGALFLLRPDPPPGLFRVAIQPWPGYAPGYLARDRASWKREGIRAIELPTDADTVRAMQARVVEAACLPLDAVIRMKDQGLDLRVVVVTDYSQGSDAVLSVGTRVATLAGLRGKRVAVERLGGGMLVLGRALRQGGLRLADVTLVNADLPDHLQLAQQNKVDALVTYAPYKQALLEAGNRLLIDSRQLPGEIVQVVVVRGDVLAGQMGAVRGLVQGWQEAAGELEEDPALASEAARAMGLTPMHFAAARGEVRRVGRSESWALVTGKTRGLTGAAEAITSDLVEFGLIPEPIPVAALFLSPAEARGLQP